MELVLWLTFGVMVVGVIGIINHLTVIAKGIEFIANDLYDLREKLLDDVDAQKTIREEGFHDLDDVHEELEAANKELSAIANDLRVSYRERGGTLYSEIRAIREAVDELTGV